MKHKILFLFMLALVVITVQAVGAQSMFPSPYTITAETAEAYSCTRPTCDVLATFSRGDVINVLSGAVGSQVNGSRAWLRLEVDGRRAFVHTSFAERGDIALEPVATSTSTAADGVTPYPQVQTYYAGSSGANLRSEANTRGRIVAQIAAGGAIPAIGYVAGEAVNAGNTTWYAVDYQGVTVFVYSSAVTQTAPTTANTSPTVVQPAQPVAPAAPPQSPIPASQWVCTGDRYNCSDFRNRTELMSYWNTCPGDPSNLDGNDNDGIPCESLR
jgi:hypothetical protein